MKKILLLISSFLLLTGASWLDLETQSSTKLNQKIDLLDADGVPYVLEVGSRLRFLYSTRLVLNAWLFQFEQEDCIDLGRSTDLELLTHTTEDYEYGVELDSECMVNIFLVTEDLYRSPIVSPIL